MTLVSFLIFSVFLSEGLMDESHFWAGYHHEENPHVNAFYRNSWYAQNPYGGAIYVQPTYQYPQHVNPQYGNVNFYSPWYLYPLFVQTPTVKPATESTTTEKPATESTTTEKPTTKEPTTKTSTTAEPTTERLPPALTCQKICGGKKNEEESSIRLDSYKMFYHKQPSHQKTPQNCAEVASPGKVVEGVFEMEVAGSKFNASCIPDPENGPSWTIIQRRVNGSVDFYRNWADYENGFGNVDGEYWLGLKTISELTNLEIYELWVQLDSSTEGTIIAKFRTFCLDDATEDYKLHVCNKYSKSKDDVLTHSFNTFSTYDRDNCECAKELHDGWWMEKGVGNVGCGLGHLNGEFKSGIHWRAKLISNVTYVHMAIRPLEITP